MIREQDALDYHAKGRCGKIEVVPSKPSLAYTPGVADVFCGFSVKFHGALDVRASAINDEMKIAAAVGIHEKLNRNGRAAQIDFQVRGSDVNYVTCRIHRQSRAGGA